MHYIVFAVFFVLVEIAVLTGVLGGWGGGVMPAAFHVGMPLIIFVVGVWKGDRRERMGIVVLALMFLIILNRVKFGLGGWAVPLVFAGSGYLTYFGVTHLGEWRQQLGRLAVGLVVVVLVFAAIVFAIPFFGK